MLLGSHPVDSRTHLWSMMMLRAGTWERVVGRQWNKME